MKYICISIILIACVVANVFNRKKKFALYGFISVILISLLLEFTIFNVKSYRLDFSKNNKYDYNYNNLNENIMEYSDGTKYINISNIDDEIKTIYVEFENVKENEYIDYQIIYGDETTSRRGLPSKQYTPSVENTKYTAVFLSGKVKNLEIRYSSNEDVKISKVQLNTEIPFEFDLIRVLVVTAILIFIYSLKNNEYWNEGYKENNLKQQRAYIILTVIAMLIVCLFNKNNTRTKYDLYSKDFVQAIEQGQFNLLQEPSEKLLNLQNPYDTVERSSIQRGTDYIWDAALYNNHYYVYFGILPALILLVPFHLITGIFMQTATGVLIFSLLSLLLIAMLIKELFKKYFSELPFKLLFFSNAILLFGSMIIWINVAPRFYELVNIAGLYFVLQGMYLFVTCEKDNSISSKRIFLGALCLALAVACRPTTLIASIFTIPFIIKFIKQEKGNKNECIKNAIAFIVPYVVVGILMMLYNYVRFGSIFEFGAKYQLTMNDMRNLKNRLCTVPLGFIYNLFNIPTVIGAFPFMQVNSNIFEIFSYYYIEDMPGGVFILSPIAFFCIFGIKKFLKVSENKELKKLVISLLIIGIILNIIIVMQAGSTGRYLLDFAIYFVLAGILVFLENYKNYKHRETKDIMFNILKMIVCITIIVNILTGFESISGVSMKDLTPKVYYNIESKICFWK